MQEVKGNLWELPADARCITTNGFVTKAGKAVMGRGCAKEATDLIPGLARNLGMLISLHGNNVHALGEYPQWGRLYSFPVKHVWNQYADPVLIIRSAEQLVAEVDRLKGEGVVLNTILIPRPGCGNGGLDWKDVKAILEPILDERFHTITF